MAITVRDIMEMDVPAIYPEDPIDKVLRTMRDNELPGIPVINEGGRCVGIITEAEAIGWLAQDVMTEEPITIHPDATVGEAAREIARNTHNRLPVVEHGRLVGVVTRIDVLDALTAD